MGVRVACSEVDLDRAFGRVDAGAQELTGLAVHAAGTQVADLPGAQLADAAVADAHATAERHARAGGLAGEQDRLLAVAGGVDATAAQANRAAAAALAVADAGAGLEVLDVQPRGIAVFAPALAERLQQPGGAAEKALALAPVGAEWLQLVRADPAELAAEAHVQAVAAVRAAQFLQLAREDHAVGVMRAVHVDDVMQLAPRGEVAQHADDRRDAAAGADQQQPRGGLLGQRERPFDAAETHDRAGLQALVEERRDLAAIDELRRDRDAAVGAARRGRE